MSHGSLVVVMPLKLHSILKATPGASLLCPLPSSARLRSVHLTVIVERNSVYECSHPTARSQLSTEILLNSRLLLLLYILFHLVVLTEHRPVEAENFSMSLAR